MFMLCIGGMHLAFFALLLLPIHADKSLLRSHFGIVEMNSGESIKRKLSKV